MRNYIKIDCKAEEVRPAGQTGCGWAPLYNLYVFYGEVMQIIGPFRASDPNQTFATKAEADSWSEQAAINWCDANYPDWPVQRL